MIYSVICTDLSNYVNWQVELLEYSFSRVNQPGELLRLVSSEPDEAVPEHRAARWIRTRPANVHPETGDEYVPYNRLFSFRQWLDEHRPEGTVLILDPDCVFTKPEEREVTAGRPIGQRWVDFSISEAFAGAITELVDVPLDSLQRVTWPALIHTDDLKALMPRWIELTAGIRQRTGRWESDMFAFIAAAAEIGLEFELGTVAAWTPWPEAAVEGAPLIHFPQKIHNEQGDLLWWKQYYRPWERVPNPQQADKDYCRDLLELVDEHAALRRFEASLCEVDTIFVAIAAYREPELVSTIHSCLDKARHPERLRFGICLQYDDSNELSAFDCLDEFSQDTRFRYVKYPYQASRGGCWARNIVQQLYDGERYTLQIDAHSQMRESWDVLLIKMLHEMPSDKPLITSFPPLYHFEGERKVFRYIDDLTSVNTALAGNWNPDGSIPHPQRMITENNSFPRRTRILSGAFVFTLGEWNREVMQDPDHFYTGEEFALTLRSYTQGYDLFDPSEIVVWHRLHPYTNPKFWTDNDEQRSRAFHDRGIERLNWLLAGDPEGKLGNYGLGSKRSLHDYYIFSGLDCQGRTVHPDAINGIPPDPVTIHQQESSASMTDSDAMILDIRIHLRDMAPLELACEQSNPILKTLFRSQLDKHADPDSVVYLDIGDDGSQSVRFRKSSLVAIETDPALPQAFFDELTRDTAGPGQAAAVANPDFSFSDEWKYWIWHNIRQRGCSRDMIFKELLLHDFPWQAIARELDHEPTIPLEYIRAVSEQQRPNRDKLLLAGVKSLSDKLELYSVDDFLNEDECARLIGQIQSRQTPSRTVLEERSSEVRTSHTCFFEAEDAQCPLANEVTSRLSKLLGINPGYAERIQGHIYQPEQQYKPHADFFSPGTAEFEKHASDEAGGQRTWTVLVYLNEVADGGATEFTNAGISVRPKRGKAVFWNNLLPSGAPDWNTVHWGKPPVAGNKFILTQWFRSIGPGEMFQRDRQEYIPAYTDTGFSRDRLPEDLFKRLAAIVSDEEKARIIDESESVLHNTQGSVPTHLLEIPEELSQELFTRLKPVLEKWCSKPLLPSAVYGIRCYRRGTTLDVHRDIPRTHIISAIVNVAQDIDEDWPLYIEDHSYRPHQVMLEPGEILLYEGGRLPHGRPTPLNGNLYCNVFVHFRPVDYVLPSAIA